MRVKVFELDEEAETREMGALVLRDGQIVPEPKDPKDTGAVRALGRLAKAQIHVLIDQQDRTIAPDKDPELFLDQLHRAYHGSYLWAGKVEK